MHASKFRLLAAWVSLGGILTVMAAALLWASPQFLWDRQLADMPALPLAAGLFAAGLAYCLVLPLIRATLATDRQTQAAALAIVIAIGVALRLTVFFSTPAFEDDWNRYLWDGAVTASGFNPYAVAPADAWAPEHEDSPLPALAEAADAVYDQINHPHLKTIYPPVAQAAFAIAYWIEPWSLAAWRLVCLAGEAATLVLLLRLLTEAGRPLCWVALYWWNPVVVKELINSAHMEAIVTPFVLLALLLSWRGRHIAGIGALGLAAGAKLWPIMLAPLLLRPLVAAPQLLLAALGTLATLLLIWALAPIFGGIDETSGFSAYAQNWQTNSALFPFLSRVAAFLLAPLMLPETASGLLVRVILAVGVALFSVWLARSAKAGSPNRLMQHAGLVTMVLVLASPAQFPWYLIWTLPFLPFLPLWSGLVASACMPLYYVSFHYLGNGSYNVFRDTWVWAIWVPVWAALMIDAIRGQFGPRRRSEQDKSNGHA